MHTLTLHHADSPYLSAPSLVCESTRHGPYVYIHPLFPSPAPVHRGIHVYAEARNMRRSSITVATLMMALVVTFAEG